MHQQALYLDEPEPGHTYTSKVKEDDIKIHVLVSKKFICLCKSEIQLCYWWNRFGTVLLLVDQVWDCVTTGGSGLDVLLVEQVWDCVTGGSGLGLYSMENEASVFDNSHMLHDYPKEILIWHCKVCFKGQMVHLIIILSLTAIHNNWLSTHVCNNRHLRPKSNATVHNSLVLYVNNTNLFFPSFCSLPLSVSTNNESFSPFASSSPKLTISTCTFSFFSLFAKRSI